MKKLVSLFIIFISISAHAQEEAGSFGYINTTISYFSKTDVEEQNYYYNNPMLVEFKTSSFSISPSISYFLSNNLAAGLGFHYGYSNTSFEVINEDLINPNISSTHISSKTPYLLVENFLPIADKLNLTFIGSLGINFSKNIYEQAAADFNGNPTTYTTEYKTSMFQANINPSIRYQTDGHLGFQLIFGRISYNHNLSDSRFGDAYDFRENEVQLNFSPEVWQIGISYHVN